MFQLFHLWSATNTRFQIYIRDRAYLNLTGLFAKRVLLVKEFFALPHPLIFPVSIPSIAIKKSCILKSSNVFSYSGNDTLLFVLFVYLFFIFCNIFFSYFQLLFIHVFDFLSTYFVCCFFVFYFRYILRSALLGASGWDFYIFCRSVFIVY